MCACENNRLDYELGILNKTGDDVSWVAVQDDDLKLTFGFLDHGVFAEKGGLNRPLHGKELVLKYRLMVNDEPTGEFVEIKLPPVTQDYNNKRVVIKMVSHEKAEIIITEKHGAGIDF